jgi:hypothetical protein
MNSKRKRSAFPHQNSKQNELKRKQTQYSFKLEATKEFEALKKLITKLKENQPKSQ